MTISIMHEKANCGCGADGRVTSDDSCCDCRMKMALTYEEEAILQKLRGIKSVVRPLLKKIKGYETLRSSAAGANQAAIEEEWVRLSQEFEGLRSAWNDLEIKLEKAIEKKWVSLGHHEPTV
ncbi:MAG: hypothetical protein ACP5VS_03650 [Desulfomonilaceae bacterium]